MALSNIENNNLTDTSNDTAVQPANARQQVACRAWRRRQ
jgi:hypothetical protein